MIPVEPLHLDLSAFGQPYWRAMTHFMVARQSLLTSCSILLSDLAERCPLLE